MAIEDDALPPSARPQPAQPAVPAVKAAPTEDDLPPSVRAAQAEAKEAARPSVNPLWAGWEATKEAAGGVKEAFWDPVWSGKPPTEGPLESAKRVGSGLLSAASLPLAPFVGAGKSVIANVTAPFLRGAEYGIKKGVQQVKPDFDPKVQTHQEAYEALLPGAEAAISALGPKRLPSGAVAPIAPVRKAPSGGLATKGGQEVTAGKMLEKAAVDPDAAIGALDASKEIVPGSKPTTFQATGDLGLGQLERVVQNTPEGQAAFQQRWAEQNNARINALREVRQGGDANTVHTHLRTAMEADDALAEMELATARTRAEQASTDLGPNVTPEIQGQILRRELDEANQRIRTREREAWEAVDPGGTLFTNAGPVSNAQFRIYGEMSEAAAASMTDAERTISGIISRSPQTVPFRDMRDLRSLVSTSMREELRARGRSPAYGRMAQLRGAIEESTRAPVDARTGQLAPDAKARLDAASEITSQRAETFKQGPVESVMKREGAAGPFEVTHAAVPGRFIPNGPKGYDHVASYLRAVGNQRGLPDIYDALVYDMRSKAMDANGNINPDKLVRWAQSKQDALRAVVERDGGALVQRLQNVEGAEGVIADVAAQRAELARLHRVGVFGKLIGVDNPTDVQNILGGVFGKQTSVTDAQAIMQRLRASPEAQVGARQAIVDWIWDKFISNTAAGTTEENIIRADQFQQFIKLKEQTLRAFGFTPDQISTWQMISDDMRMTKQSVDATKMRGGPGTAQDLNAMYQMREDQGTSLFRKIAYRLMAGSLGWAVEGPLGGAAAMFGAGVVSSMRDRGIKSVQALVKDAMMNPGTARRLLARARGREVMPWQKRWIGYEAAAQQQGQPQQPPQQGFKHGGAVRPLGREGIKARNKARAAAARERSSLARGTAQAKGKVKYQDGGPIGGSLDNMLEQEWRRQQQEQRALPDNTPLTGPNELFEGQFDPTARGAARASAGGWGRQYGSRGDIIAPQNPKSFALRMVPNDALPQPELGKRTPLEQRLNLDPLEQDYHRSFGAPATEGLSADPPYPVYAGGGPVPYPIDSPEFKEEVQRALAKNPDTIAKAQEFIPQVPINAPAWQRFINETPRSSRIEDRRKGFARGGAIHDDSSKATKASVKYGKGMPKAHCGICTHWRKGTCTEVKGTIYASMWCELFKRKGKYQEGGLVEEDPLEAEKRRRNVPGGLSATAGSTVTSTTPVQDIPAPKVNKEGETLPTYVLKEMGKGLLGAPEHFTHAAGDLQRRGEYAGSQEDMPYGGPPPEEMPAGAAAALMLYGANAPFPKPGIGVFGGRGAKTANKGMLAEAEKMLAAGVPHATIRNRTGWEFGSEGKPKFEISDAESRIIREHPEDRIYEADAASRATGLRPNQRLEQILHHPRLYEAYPWLRDMQTSLDVGAGTKPAASYMPPKNKGKALLGMDRGEIEVRAPTYERGGVGDLFEKQYASDVGARDMLLHEIQHAIQQHEGFAPGANPMALPIKPSEITTIAQNMAKRNGIDWDAATPKDRQMMERVIRHRIYKAQAGEAEARNVQTRADSDLPSRPSWETEDIKRENQMIDKRRKLKPGEKPFNDAKIYKSEYEPELEARTVGREAPAGGGRSPGIYKDPRQVAREAAELIPPEHPALKALFGVTREDLYGISQQGRRPGNLPDPAWTAIPKKSRGSAAAEGVMTPGNEQRILDAMVEGGKHRGIRLADAWYVMDPAYQRLEYLHGPELAKRLYDRMNTTGAMASPASGVWDEIRRGTAANMMAHQGQFPLWRDWAGIAMEHRPPRGQPFVPIKGVTSRHVEHLAGQKFPPQLREIPGHLAHRTAHAGPMEKYLESGVVEMGTPKVPTYIPASGVPETGFQTRWMVPDAHISKSLGMGDTRTQGTVRQGASMSMPEYRQIAPWYRQRIAEPLGVEAVPAQARQWTLFGPQTGVRTMLGIPKLELLAQRIWEQALEKGLDPKVLRDQVLSGGAYAGLAGGIIGPALTAGLEPENEGSSLANDGGRERKRPPPHPPMRQ